MKDQIEEKIVEMAKFAFPIYNEIKPDLLRTAIFGNIHVCKPLENLYNAGYRKQSEGENISQMHPSDQFICEKCGLIIRECCRYEIDEDDGDEICYEFPYRFCPRCGMKVKGDAE